MDQDRRPFRLGRLLPTVVFLVALANYGGRFLRIDPFATRPWEALKRYAAADGPFEANRVCERPRAYGDLAALGNLPADRRYRREVWTTDAYGFRNPPSLLDGEPIRVILCGDSYAAGSGLNDSETLAIQLGRVSGLKVYNAGSMPVDLPDVVALADRLRIQRGLVVYEYLEREPVPDIPGAPVRPSRGVLRRSLALLRGWASVSPLQIESQSFMKSLEDDVIFPNVAADRVVRSVLTNGDAMLFWPADVDAAKDDAPLRDEYFVWLGDHLRTRSLDLLVLLVPNKYVVYGPVPSTVERLGRLAQQLAHDGIPVVDVTSTFRREAQDRLPRHAYIYYLDDTHWNADGVAIAAELVNRRMKAVVAKWEADVPGATGRVQ